MRTAPCDILLFNDKLIMNERVLILKQNMQGESKTVERQKKRECERQSVAGNENSISNKIDC
jgi:hypothetical protein